MGDMLPPHQCGRRGPCADGIHIDHIWVATRTDSEGTFALPTPEQWHELGTLLIQREGVFPILLELLPNMTIPPGTPVGSVCWRVTYAHDLEVARRRAAYLSQAGLGDGYSFPPEPDTEDPHGHVQPRL
jgi:hypothetical protein